MRFHKSEIIFLVFLALIASGTYLVYSSVGQLQTGMRSMGNGPMALRLGEIETTLIAACVLLGTSFVGGLLLIYPLMRLQVRESGKLEVMTRTLTEKSATFQQAALTDALTGLQNRRYFDDALAEYLEEFGRIGRPIGVMIIDLDHFKKVNDTYGHDVGDIVLKELGQCLMEFTRYHDIVARLGGEEFAVVAPNLDMYSLKKLAERIRMAVENLTIRAGSTTLKVTASIGIATWDGQEDGMGLYKRADAQLYHAKNGGRNRVAAAA